MLSSLCFTVLVLIITDVDGKTLSKLTNFDDYIEILQQTLDFKQKLRIIAAVWGEIRSDYADDLDKAGGLYRQLDYTIEAYLQIRKELQAAEELRQELRLHLVRKQAELIAKSWSGHSYAYTQQMELLEHLNSMFENYDTTLLAEIYKRAIDLVYDAVEPQVLAAHVRHAFVMNNKKSYEAAFEAQLYLLWKFKGLRDVSDKFLFDVGYYMHKFQAHNFFRHLERRLQLRFTKAINDLPATLKGLYFENEFCLLNKEYEEYLYITNAIDIDEERRYVLTGYQRGGKVNPGAVWRTNLTESGGDSLKLQFAFKGKESGLYMYLEPSVKDYKYIVNAWKAGGAPSGSAWSLRLEHDVLLLEYDKKLLCASSELLDGRHLVYGRWDEKNNPGTKNCHWQAVACSNDEIMKS